ncbi:MAG: enoyl-CoA hydratase/isomerase family protein [Xanthobacteraceae bacterium]
MTTDTDILFVRRGAAGIVTLNRPQALNAVTHGMVRALAAKLAEWAKDEGVTRIVITAAGERAFSAGGDIRALYELGKSGRHGEALQFWRDEYMLNTLIKRYPKPYIALIDGIVMGGGVGISIHGSHRVAGDKFQFAMPEVGIGFFPDVGATWFLPRLPGEIGTFCALTGERMKNADAVRAGVVTHYAASPQFPAILEALTENETPDAILDWFGEKLGIGPLWLYRQALDRLFAADRVEDILAALDREAISHSAEAGWAGATAAAMRGKSPLSLKIALAQLRRGREWSFTDCMKAEFRIVSRIIHGHDFYEGVRAVIIDKDNAPRWKPPRLNQVLEADIDRYFAPLETELELP